MKKTLLVAAGATLLAGGLAYYFLSRSKKDAQRTEEDEHQHRVAGEKQLRRAFRWSKQHSIARD
jgi:hypothetical protein